MSLTKIFMNNENIRIDYVIVQTFPITPLGFIVQGSYFLDVNVLVLSVSRLATKKSSTAEYFYELCGILTSP